MGRRSTSRAPGGTAGSIPQSSIAAGTGAGLFESADGKDALDQVASGAPTDSASLANAATLTLQYATTTNREHQLICRIKATIGATRYVFRWAADFENVSGTVTLLAEQALQGPASYASPPGVTISASVSGTNAQFSILNSTGGAITNVRMRLVRSTTTDPS